MKSRVLSFPAPCRFFMPLRACLSPRSPCRPSCRVLYAMVRQRPVLSRPAAADAMPACCLLSPPSFRPPVMRRQAGGSQKQSLGQWSGCRQEASGVVRAGRLVERFREGRQALWNFENVSAGYDIFHQSRSRPLPPSPSPPALPGARLWHERLPSLCRAR